MTNQPKRRHSNNSWRQSDLRHGYTTSACAAACAVAGMQALDSGKVLESVTIDLPVEHNVTFQIVRCEFHAEGVLCGTIKDSGDDPDITDGAEIQSFVAWREQPGIEIRGGKGVGTVTKPGLPVEIGEPAINPGSRRLIRRVVTAHGADILSRRGISIEIRVPKGEELAEETLNPRLGIIGGISILGTSGVLKPYSNAAYRASIHSALSVAQTNGANRVVLTTGSRSEQYAMKLYPDLPPFSFIQVGDHMDYALKQGCRLGVKSTIISGMIGKLSKLAQGRMQTHVSQGGIDLDFLAEVATELGADEALADSIRRANTAHHVQKLLEKTEVDGLEQTLAKMAGRACLTYAPELNEIEILLFTIGGDLLARKHIRRET